MVASITGLKRSTLGGISDDPMVSGGSSIAQSVQRSAVAAATGNTSGSGGKGNPLRSLSRSGQRLGGGVRNVLTGVSGEVGGWARNEIGAELGLSEPSNADRGPNPEQQKAFARSRRNLAFLRGDRARRSALRGQNVNPAGSASILSGASAMQSYIPGPTGASGVRA